MVDAPRSIGKSTSIGTEKREKEKEDMSKQKGMVILLGLVVMVGGWWIVRADPIVQPEEGVVDVWATWGQDADPLQGLFDRYSQASGMPVKVTTGVGSDKVLKAMSGPAPPDIVVLSSGDLVHSLHEQDLVEPLDRWVEATGIALDDIYPASLAQCQTPEGDHACLPWGCDVFALFWNKDLFEAAGLDPERPPQTVEELFEYAARLTVRDEEGEIRQIGFIPDFPRSHSELYARVFGGSPTDEVGTESAVESRPTNDAANWQRQFYEGPGSAEVKRFVSSFDRYVNSSHPLYAGRRLSCQQCHLANPRVNSKIPEHGFYDGKVAMMVDGQWPVWPSYAPHSQPELDYGVAPFPPPADHTEWCDSVMVEGPVVVIPTGAEDRAAAADLLAWMMTPEIVAEEAYTRASLPTNRVAAQDPRFQQIPNFDLFVQLLAHPDASSSIPTPARGELNEAMGWVVEVQSHHPAEEPRRREE